MTKKNFQDVVPPSHSIRNIKIPSRRTNVPDVSEVVEEIGSAPKSKHRIEMKKPITLEAEPIQSDPKSEYTYTYDEKDTRHSSRNILYVSIAIFLLAIGFGISVFFKSAHISVTPRSQSQQVTATFIAQKNVTNNTLGYQIVTVTKEAQLKVPATGEQNVSTKARGTIVIYNNASVVPQKLIATTRFQTQSGLVYRLVNAATIPGKQTIASKIIPGSVEALVEADKAGDSYNIALSDFSLPAFKGDPKFTTIYGRSKTLMSGGFVGTQKNVSVEALKSADDGLKLQLMDMFSKNIASQIPANFILYNEGISYSFTDTTQIGTTGSDAELQKKGTAMAIIFDKTALSREIIGQVLPSNTDPIKVDNLETLKFAFAPGEIFDPTTSTQLSFLLSGESHLVWTFDENKLKNDLLGLSKSQARVVGSKYTAIKEMSIETQPFWNQTIPSDQNKVTLTNTLVK